ncbi:helix-hairpin-helix domain-containing protein [Halobaculum sp. P14]|uniref:helix-hairpin-helix domain-containing protein n=1 Tax=Halobaculum sp. P14 TaxID=3421638 RepID=UPI003EBB711C
MTVSVDLLVAAGIFVSCVAISTAKGMLEERGGKLPVEWQARLGLLDLRDPRTKAEIDVAYRRDLISEAEMERRKQVLLDDRNEQIFRAVTAVSGIGPKKALNIAATFESERAVRRASLEELEQVPGIGPKYAEAIKARLGREVPDTPRVAMEAHEAGVT